MASALHPEDLAIVEGVRAHLRAARADSMPFHWLRLGGHLPAGVLKEDFLRLARLGLLDVEVRATRPFTWAGKRRAWRQLIVSLPSR